MDGGLAGMQSRSVTVFAVTIAVFVVATIFVVFRFLSRVWVVKRVTLDDYIMAVAWAIAFGLAVAICYGATVGLGRHEVDVPMSWQLPLRRSQFAFSLLYQPALMAEKTSILVFYLTLSKSNKVFRWATIATLVVVNGVGFALTMFTAFQCSPPSAAYTYPRPSNAQCTDIVTIYLSSSPVNIITDLAILLLPMPILTGMRLPKKQKIILVITFSFGAFVAVVDVIRVAYLQNASTYRLQQIQTNGSDDPNIDLADFSWYASLSFMWTAIEVNVGIMCACVPGLKPLVSRFAPKFIHDTSLQTSERTSTNLAEQMIEQQRIPSLTPGSGEFVHRDFAPQSPPVAHRQSLRPQPLNQDAPMDMMQFLTTPEMNSPRSPTFGSEGNALRRTDTVLTNTSRDTNAASPTFFDFVNMQGKRSMVQMTNRESLFPVTMVTVLFFVWGFEYGLLDVLNRQFQTVARQTPGQNVGLHSAYFVGYFAGSLTIGRLVLKKWGFKACYNVGLGIYACGTLIFWVAAVLTSFPAYLVVNFIVGVGLSILEAGANPFITLCGPQQYAEIRLNLSQGFQAIGTIVAPLIAQKAFTKYTDDAPSLINTQWAYLGIALFTIMLAFAYYYVPLPEATDAELEDACERMDHAHYATLSVPFSANKTIRIIWPILALGVFAQFCYVGAQEVYSTNFDSYTLFVRPDTNVTNFMSIAHTAFAVSRFIAAFLGLWIKPRILLLFFFLGSILFSTLTMNFSGDTAMALLIVSFFFEGPLFSLIFAQSLRGMGKHTKDASIALTAAIGGGALFPALSYVADVHKDARYAMAVAVAAFAGGTLMPLALNLVKPMRKVVDPIWEEPSLPDNEERRPSTAEGEHHEKGSLKRGLGILGLCKKDSSGKESGEGASYRERHGSGDSAASPRSPR